MDKKVERPKARKSQRAEGTRERPKTRKPTESDVKTSQKRTTAGVEAKDDKSPRKTPTTTRTEAPRRIPLSALYADDSESSEIVKVEERKTKTQQREERRMKLIQELVRSEEKHVEALKSMKVNFLGPLKEKKILTAQQIKNLFGNIELILAWNMDFLDELKRTLEVSDYFQDLIVKMCRILRQLFTQYNANYQLAQETYKECLKSNKEFEHFIQKQANSKSDLLTSLYLPIQRMIMYDSLLKDIVMLTPKHHKDYRVLWTAYKELRAMDKAANRVLEKRKNLDTVIKIQNSLIGNVCIAQPHRHYVFEEDLMLVQGKVHRERTLFLFNDILLVTKLKRRKSKYDVEVILPLYQITVDNCKDDRHLFKIIVLDNPKTPIPHTNATTTTTATATTTVSAVPHAPHPNSNPNSNTNSDDSNSDTDDNDTDDSESRSNSNDGIASPLQNIVEIPEHEDDDHCEQNEEHSDGELDKHDSTLNHSINHYNSSSNFAGSNTPGTPILTTPIAGGATNGFAGTAPASTSGSTSSLNIPPLLPVMLGGIVPLGSGEFLFHSNEKPSWIQLLNSTIKKLGALPSEVNTLRVEEAEHAEAADFIEHHSDDDEEDDAADAQANGSLSPSYRITKRKLMKKILKWNSIGDPETVMLEIAQMAKLIHKYERRSEGNDLRTESKN